MATVKLTVSGSLSKKAGQHSASVLARRIRAHGPALEQHAPSAEGDLAFRYDQVIYGAWCCSAQRPSLIPAWSSATSLNRGLDAARNPEEVMVSAVLPNDRQTYR